MGYVHAHEHEYGDWIVDRCGALTGIGVRHRVCLTCGESQRGIFDGPDHRMRVSILGDSYSTFAGWIPDGAISWYGDPTRASWNQTDVHEVEQTWWHLLLTSLDADLCVNNSSSGTTISDYGYDGADVRMTSFIERAGSLGESPDLILVFGGTNDAWADDPIGYWSSKYTGRPIRSFLPAMRRMCEDLNRLYPKAQKIMIVNELLNHQWGSSYVDTMYEVAEYYGWKACGVDIINCRGNDHPNQVGMRLIAKAVEEEIFRETEWTIGAEQLGELTMSATRCENAQVELEFDDADHLSATVVKYTLDGSEPTTNSLTYVGPFRVAVPFTVRARAFHPQLGPSMEVSEKFKAPFTEPTDEWWGAHSSLVAKLGGVKDASLPSPGSDGQGKRKSDGTLMTVWEDFLSGTDPEDSLSVLRAFISMSGTRPVVTWDPVLPPSEAACRTYVILGAQSVNGPWSPVDMKTTSCRFFRVRVDPW